MWEGAITSNHICGATLDSRRTITSASNIDAARFVAARNTSDRRTATPYNADDGCSAARRTLGAIGAANTIIGAHT